MGPTYQHTRTGIEFVKSSPLVQPIFKALQAVFASGQYKAILDNWGISSAAIDAPTINGALS
jgi:ABC-type amino acid transport substrate-binding protein